MQELKFLHCSELPRPIIKDEASRDPLEPFRLKSLAEEPAPTGLSSGELFKRELLPFPAHGHSGRIGVFQSPLVWPNDVSFLPPLHLGHAHDHSAHSTTVVLSESNSLSLSRTPDNAYSTDTNAPLQPGFSLPPLICNVRSGRNSRYPHRRWLGPNGDFSPFLLGSDLQSRRLLLGYR